MFACVRVGACVVLVCALLFVCRAVFVFAFASYLYLQFAFGFVVLVFVFA